MGRRATPPATGLHMFVAGLNFICTERELEHKFDEFGKVKEARVVRNPATGESRGFGFVALDHDDEVDDAIRALNGAEWNGRRLLVERARHVR
jgi:transformer-2 protein